jgi:hypothetical protein
MPPGKGVILIKRKILLGAIVGALALGANVGPVAADLRPIREAVNPAVEGDPEWPEGTTRGFSSVEYGANTSRVEQHGIHHTVTDSIWRFLMRIVIWRASWMC